MLNMLRKNPKSWQLITMNHLICMTRKKKKGPYNIQDWTAPSENVSLTYADSEGPDQTAHKRSLIRAIAVC